LLAADWCGGGSGETAGLPAKRCTHQLIEASILPLFISIVHPQDAGYDALPLVAKPESAGHLGLILSVRFAGRSVFALDNPHPAKNNNWCCMFEHSLACWAVLRTRRNAHLHIKFGISDVLYSPGQSDHRHRSLVELPSQHHELGDHSVSVTPP
jgi:hypothetical protein